MPALIPEFIAMATDPSIKTSALLRKAMVAARPEWATWVGYELQGYPDEIGVASEKGKNRTLSQNPSNFRLVIR